MNEIDKPLARLRANWEDANQITNERRDITTEVQMLIGNYHEQLHTKHIG